MGTQTQTSDLQTEGRIIRRARFYDLSATLMSLGHEGALRQETVERAGVQPGQQVLDVGCGTGALTLAAARQAGAAGEVYGIDASPDMIRAATRKAARAGARVTLRAGLIERLAFPDQSFDVVLSSLMMHHLTDELRRRGLREVRRVLKPGGRVFIVDFNGGAGVGLHNLVARLGHGGRSAAPWDVRDLPRLLTEAGFEDVTSGAMGLRSVGFAAGRTPRQEGQ
jgi:ubiquinone/menaquinone biosynthesis C-methylase UbiE